MCSPATIAIVDDDDAVRESLEALVSGSGFETRCYATGEELLGSWSAEQPDCVLLDIDLPGLDGWQILERIRSMNATAPVILITGRSHRRDEAAAARGGACRILRKPFSDEMLIEAVQQELKSTGRIGP